jgi:hypothetical protein
MDNHNFVICSNSKCAQKSTLLFLFKSLEHRPLSSFHHLLLGVKHVFHSGEINEEWPEIKHMVAWLYFGHSATCRPFQSSCSTFNSHILSKASLQDKEGFAWYFAICTGGGCDATQFMYFESDYPLIIVT